MRERTRLLNFKAWDKHLASLRLGGAGSGIPEAWFLGPKAENEDLLAELIAEAIREHSDFRVSYQPGDPVHITPAIKRSKDYRDAVARLRRHAAELFEVLKKSAPVFSMRSQGHMLWDQALPAPRNVAGIWLGKAARRGRRGGHP